MSDIDRLIRIASEAICVSDALFSLPTSEGDFLPAQLKAMLEKKNGFYAFEQALHIFPHCESASGYSLSAWNASDLWKGDYGALLADTICFAEDIFGEQFCLGRNGDAVFRFNPETGSLSVMAADLNGWAARILSDYNVETGYSLAHEWQLRNGALLPGRRLVPTILFALGGGFRVENLHSIDAVEGMRFRAHIWQQIKDLPEETNVHLKVER